MLGEADKCLLKVTLVLEVAGLKWVNEGSKESPSDGSQNVGNDCGCRVFMKLMAMRLRSSCYIQAERRRWLFMKHKGRSLPSLNELQS